MLFYFVKIDTSIVLHKKVLENTTYCFDKTCAVISCLIMTLEL